MVISISTSEEMPWRNGLELLKSSPGCPHEGISCMVIMKLAFAFDKQYSSILIHFFTY